MTIMLIIAFGVIALAAVLLPLLTRSREASRHEGGPAALEEREAGALAALRDLEFDQRLGKLAEEDYRELRAQLARRAVAELKAEDAARQAEAAPAPELEDLIEREVAALRRAGRQPVANPGLPNGLPPAVQPEGTGKRSACLACGQAVEPGDRFCVACGAALPQACPHCAAILPANARFCPQCGCEAPEPAAAASPRLVELLWYDPELAALFPREASPTALKTAPARSAGRSSGSKWLLAAGVVAAVWAGIVGVFYFRARAAIESQQPITTLATADYRTLAILPADPNFAFLGHRGGLMWSSDGGVTWQPASVTGNVLALAVQPANPLRLYAAGPGLFLRSDDGGRNWETIGADLLGRDIQALAVAPDNPEVLYAFVVGQGLWRSANGGLNWTPVDPTLSENVTALAVTPGTIYVGTDSAGVLRSGDGGATWASANGIANGALDSPRVRALVYDPTTETLYAGTDRGLSFTTNTGSGWIRRPFSGDVAALALSPEGTTMLLVTSAGEVYRSRDRGVTWDGQ